MKLHLKTAFATILSSRILTHRSVGDMIVVNESRLGRNSVQENFKVSQA